MPWLYVSIDDLAGILGTRFVFGWIKSVEVYWVRIAWRVKGNIGVFLSKALYGVLAFILRDYQNIETGTLF
ncbi:hypothetical protein C5167_040004 [Papaver somniferum]|uniref:Uncharacterized protein n=1 Tax=Papaver somniferum TaxID=3469 RepID=A0A4Y7IHY5_PAPSO|nr:hypothetical protein C5167_040004 [Papaver somniferum]